MSKIDAQFLRLRTKEALRALRSACLSAGVALLGSLHELRSGGASVTWVRRARAS